MPALKTSILEKTATDLLEEARDCFGAAKTQHNVADTQRENAKQQHKTADQQLENAEQQHKTADQQQAIADQQHEKAENQAETADKLDISADKLEDLGKSLTSEAVAVRGSADTIAGRGIH